MPSYEMHDGSTVYQMCGAGAGEPDENNPGRKVVSRITILTVPRVTLIENFASRKTVKEKA